MNHKDKTTWKPYTDSPFPAFTCTDSFGVRMRVMRILPRHWSVGAFYGAEGIFGAPCTTKIAALQEARRLANILRLAFQK